MTGGCSRHAITQRVDRDILMPLLPGSQWLRILVAEELTFEEVL
jgi:hypothetical protein